MTLTDELKSLHDKIKSNQAEYDLDREVCKISALSSKELGKYEYSIGEDLGYKPGVAEKVKFEHSPLGEALNNKAKSKANKTDKRGKVVNTEKQDKNLIYNSQHSFVKFKDIKEL